MAMTQMAVRRESEVRQEVSVSGRNDDDNVGDADCNDSSGQGEPFYLLILTIDRKLLCQ